MKSTLPLMLILLIVGLGCLYTAKTLPSLSPDFLYRHFITMRPSLEGRPYIGDPAAPIVVVFSGRIPSPEAAEFAARLYPMLSAEYIDTGKVRLYHKHQVTAGELDGEQLLATCLWLENRSAFSEAYPRLLASLPGEPLKTTGESGGSACPPEAVQQAREDAWEVERFGSAGISPRILIGFEDADQTTLQGIPSEERLRQVIRMYEIKVGE